MANDLLIYTKENKDAESLNYSERIRAPKRHDTSVAHEGMSRPSWNAFDSIMSSVVSIAGMASNRALQAHKMDAQEARQAEVDSKDRILSAKNEIKASYTKFKNGLMVAEADTSVEDYDPSVFSNANKIKMLQDFEAGQLQTIAKYKLSDSEKKDVLNGLDTVLSPDLKTWGTGAVKDYKKANAVRLNRLLQATITEDFNNTNVPLVEILKNTENIQEGLANNDSPVDDILKVITDNLSAFSDNKEVLTKRLNELKAMSSGEPTIPSMENTQPVSNPQVGSDGSYHAVDAVAMVSNKYNKELTYIEKYIVMKEGYNPNVYTDAKGIQTTGVGQTGEYADKPFPDVVDAFTAKAKKHFKNFDGYPESVQAVLVAAMYRGDVKKDYTWVKAFNEGDYETAAKHIIDTPDYYKYQGVHDRLDEASDVIKAIDNTKDLESDVLVASPSFMKYKSELNRLLGAIEKKDVLHRNKVKAAQDKEAKNYIKEVKAYTTEIPSTLTAIDTTTIMANNIQDVVTSGIQGLDDSKFVSSMKALGYSDDKIADEKNKYVVKFLINKFIEDEEQSTGRPMNLSNVPDIFKDSMKKSLDSKWNEAMANGEIASLEVLINSNPEYLKPKFKTDLLQRFNSLLTIEDEEAWGEQAATLLKYTSEIDSSILKSSLSTDDKVKLQLLNRATSKQEYKDILQAREDAGKTLTIARGNIPQEVKDFEETIQYNDVNAFREEVNLQLLTTGHVDMDILEKSFGVDEFGEGEHKVSHKFLETFNSNQEIVDIALGDIPDGCAINVIRGNVTIDDEHGIRIGAVSVADFKRRIKDIQDIRTASASWDNEHHKGLWSKLWSGLGNELDERNPYRYAEGIYTKDIKNTK